jgi:hypothetical protein
MQYGRAPARPAVPDHRTKAMQVVKMQREFGGRNLNGTSVRGHRLANLQRNRMRLMLDENPEGSFKIA